MQRLFTLFIVFSLSASVLVKAVAHKKSGSDRSSKHVEYRDKVSKYPGFYMGAGIGWSGAQKFKERDPVYINDRPDTRSATFNIHAGYKINKYFRADLNTQYRRFRYDPTSTSSMGGGTISYNQKVNNYSLFVNGYADLPNKTRFTPYVTVGVGYSHNEGKDLTVRSSAVPVASFTSSGNSNGDFAWNIGIGSRIKIDDLLDLDLSYRYLDLGKVKVNATKNGAGMDIPAASQDLKVHQVLFNLNYHF